MRTRLLTFDGKTLSETAENRTVPPAASTLIATFDEKPLLGGADPRASFAVFDLLAGGQVVSENLVFFDAARNLRLPPARIERTVKAENGRTAVTLVSPTLARSVCLSFGDADATPSDNYFDLLPGQPLTIEVAGSARSVRVTSLADALAAR